MILHTLVCLLVPLSTLVIAQTQPADQLRQQIESEVAGLPVLNADSLQQVVQFGIEHDMLTVRTSLANNGGAARIMVPGMKGVVRFTAFGTQDANTDATQNFQLIQQDLTDPQAGPVITMVSAVAGRVMLSRDQGTEPFTSSVQLIGDAQAGGEPQEQPVRLFVQQFRGPEAKDELRLSLSATSFVQLCLQHPREVDLYLRPILRDFGQEAIVLAVPAYVAWQVLGQDYTPDEQITSRVTQLVVQLGADEFRQREAAGEELAKLGAPAAIVLGRMDRSQMSPQQSSSVDSFLAQFMPLTAAQVASLRNDQRFLLDVLYTDEATLRQLALGRLSKLLGRPVSLQDGLDDKSRAQAVTKLREQLIPTTQKGTDQPGQ